MNSDCEEGMLAVGLALISQPGREEAMKAKTM